MHIHELSYPWTYSLEKTRSFQEILSSKPFRRQIFTVENILCWVFATSIKTEKAKKIFFLYPEDEVSGL